ncbi:hypothetical protein D9M71_460330 [compost metagenome]
MQRRLQAQAQFPRISFLRLTSQARTSIEVVIHGFFEGDAQLRDRLRVKTDHIAYTCDVANQQLVFIAVFNTGGIAFVVHDIHGVTPACSRNNRASRI